MGYIFREITLQKLSESWKIWKVPSPGIEPGPTVLQTDVQTTTPERPKKEVHPGIEPGPPHYE